MRESRSARGSFRHDQTRHRRREAYKFALVWRPSAEPHRTKESTSVELVERCRAIATSTWATRSTNSAEQAATERDTGGVVIDGGCRDVADVQVTGLWLASLHVTPVSGKGRVKVDGINIPITVCSITVNPGDYIIADETGVVCVHGRLLVDALPIAEESRCATTGLLMRFAMEVRSARSPRVSGISRHDYDLVFGRNNSRQSALFSAALRSLRLCVKKRRPESKR